MKRSCPWCRAATYLPPASEVAAQLEREVTAAMAGMPPSIEAGNRHYALGYLGASVADAIPRLLGLCPECGGKKHNELMVRLGLRKSDSVPAEPMAQP